MGVYYRSGFRRRRENGFFVFGWLSKENEREFFFIWSRRTPSDVVPLSTAQGWLDAYFVNIRTCEVKRNVYIQKGTNKPTRKKENTYGVDPAINGVSGDFSFPSIAFLLLVVVITCRAAFHWLSFLFPSSDWIFSLIGTIEMRTQDKSA